MKRVLVVDDSELDRQLAVSLLGDAGFATGQAADGVEALEHMAEEPPDIVLTDLQMPGMNGLQLVEAVRKRYPRVPVVLVTAHGSEEIAAAALRAGAASYIPKRYLHRDGPPTLRRVLDTSGAQRGEREAVRWLIETTHRFLLDNSCAWMRPLVHWLQEETLRRELCDETAVIQVGMALNEALTNACHHGNLELDSAVREEGLDSWFARVEERRTRPPFRDRQVRLDATFGREEATFLVHDEGPGFRPDTIPDPRDPANLMRPSGRGLLLIRTFMDEVSHNERGNEITMRKRRAT